MKTIFIPLFFGIEGKNVLRGGIYDELRSGGVAGVVFFVGNNARAQYYRREYPEAVFEVIKRYKRGLVDRMFSRLKFFTLNTETTDLKRKTNFKNHRSQVRYFFSLAANRVMSSVYIRRAARFLDEKITRDSVVTPFFEKYKPDLVFLPDLFEDTEISMLREARRRKIPTVGFISTWDRLTSRWGIRMVPDWLIVFNNAIRDEAVAYADIPDKKIFVSGAVQLDLHIKKKPESREIFMKKMNLSSDTKLIVYGPLGRTIDKTKQSDVEMVKLLNDFVEDGSLGDGRYKIIVRFPPNDFVDKNSLVAFPHVIYDIPGVRFATIRGQDWDMKPEELDHLRDLIFNSSLVVCYYSSLSIDAAVFDVPVININFDLHDRWRRHPYYETTHYSKVRALGGIRLVESPEKLLEAMRQYLKNPSLDHVGRQAVVLQQSFKLDGKSASRISRFLLEKAETH